MNTWNNPVSSLPGPLRIVEVRLKDGNIDKAFCEVLGSIDAEEWRIFWWNESGKIVDVIEWRVIN